MITLCTPNIANIAIFKHLYTEFPHLDFRYICDYARDETDYTQTLEEAIKISRYKRIGIACENEEQEKYIKKYIENFTKKNSSQSKNIFITKSLPLLKPLIEENWEKKPETKSILRKYLCSLKSNNIDTLVLLSPYFDLLEKEFEKKMGKNCRVLLHSRIEAKKYSTQIVQEREELHEENKIQNNNKQFFVNTNLYTLEKFQSIAQKFFCEGISKKSIQPIMTALISDYQSSYALFTEIFENKKTAEEIENILQELSLENLEKNEIYAQNFVEIVAGAAQAMQEHAIPVFSEKETFDVCGTGGSGNAKPFNISTASSLIVASQGVCMAKHGNRAASSKSGSADVLEALHLNLAQNAEEMSMSLAKNNMAFLFAQVLHPAMKFIMPIRKKLGIPTIFNIMGPLTNPSLPTRQVTGVSKKEFVLPMAQILKKLGRKSAIVLFGEDGLDDATLCGKTYYAQFSEENENDEIKTGYFTPEQFGFLPQTAKDIAGGKNTAENAKIITDILSNKDHSAKRDIVLLNAGIAFYISTKTASIEEGIALAEKAIISGEAQKLLKTL